MGGRGGKEIRDAFKVRHTLRKLEVTLGQNGAHPHVHALLFVTDELTPAQLKELRQEVFARWEAAVRRDGRTTPLIDYGIDITRTDDGASRYLTKMGLASELLTHATKEAKHGNLTPWQILARYSRTNTEPDRRAWRRYCEAFRGARQLTASKGFWQYFDSLRRPDEVPARVDATPVAYVTAAAYRNLRKSPAQINAVLEAVETGNHAALTNIVGVTGWVPARVMVDSADDMGGSIHAGLVLPADELAELTEVRRPRIMLDVSSA
jgi:hypothetical protein